MSSNFKYTLLIILFSLLVKFGYFGYAKYIHNNRNLKGVKGYQFITARNDTGWYKKIATNWYPQVTERKQLGFFSSTELIQSPWAFFPFYPGMNRVLMKSFCIPFEASAFYLSILFSILSFIGFYVFAREFLKSNMVAFYSTLLLIVFPTHFYFSMMYTEAPFFTFLIFSFVAVQRRQYWALLLLLIPLVLMRPNGIFALVPLYLFYLEREGILSLKHLSFKQLFSRRNILKSIYFISGPLAFMGYLFYQECMTNEYFAFSIAQIGWYKEFTLPYKSLFRHGGINSMVNSLITIAMMLFSIVIARKLPISLNILIWILIILPLTAGSAQSMGRYISIIFPITLIMGALLYKFKFRYAVLVILFCIQLYLFEFWLNSHPLSY